MYQLEKEFNPQYFKKISDDARRDKKMREVAEYLFKELTTAASTGARSAKIDLNTGWSTIEADKEVINLIKEAGFEVIPNTASMGKFLIKW